MGLLFILQMIYEYGGMILTEENLRTRRKPCPNATLSSTNPSWTDLGANPDLRDGTPTTNRAREDFIHEN
jgi:hypothetical protein